MMINIVVSFTQQFNISTSPLSWFNPGRQLSPTQPLTHSPGGGGERIGMLNVRKLMYQDKGNLIGEFNLFFPHILLLSIPYGMENPLLSCPSCVLPSSLCTPRLLTGGVV